MHWFYIHQANRPAIEAASRRHVGVFLISPNDKGGKLYERPGRLCEPAARLHPTVFNDLFYLSHPQVHTPSMGVTAPGDFDLHVEAVERLAEAHRLLGAQPVKRLSQTQP